jgi:hypothetical protein
MAHGDSSTADRHRAMYILERGQWRATCRACGYTLTDPRRRQAASLFRNHIRDAAAALMDCEATVGTEAPQIQPLQL